MTQICPWCQMEIVWDDEFGPESNCPHCYNELGEYRTLSIPVKRNERGDMFEDDSDGEWNKYANAVQDVLDEQDDVPECPLCQEYMVLAGKQTVTERELAPNIPSAGSVPFLTPPYRTDVFVCSHCFTFQYRLSEEDRMRTIRTLAGRKARRP
ncbi:hypothetical protein [Paenibacillus alkalitolerans]|uniref:hypothetical protein n=1 Tax=Paenibacillus alkalitolerans TaxID=2799335 RepID=UPI0018F6BC94|nr:hypothetical protein [Paenibacillus alkalitolerans]